MSKTSIVISLFVIAFWGCSTHKMNEIPKHIRKLKNLTVYPGSVKPEYNIKFDREITFDSTGTVIIGRIGGIAVGDLGRIFIVDTQQNTIDAFERDGHYITHFGQKGKGPGDFESAVDLKILGNRLYIYDLSLLRINIFSLDSLKFVRSISQDLKSQKSISALDDFIPMQVLFINKDKFLAVFQNMKLEIPGSSIQKKDNIYERYYFMDNDGRIISRKIFDQRRHTYLTANIKGHYFSINTSPLLGHTIVSVTKDGNIFSAWSEDFLIKEYNPKGKYLQAIYYSFKKKLLTREAAIKTVEGNRIGESIIRQSNIPKTWPALNGMKIDDQNRLWVSTIVKNMNVYEWWVLNQKGKLLAQFTWPRNKPIKVIKNGNIYTQETDTTTGMSKVVRYRIEMNPSEK